MALLELRKVSKAFPGVQALNQVDMDVRAGEVHALIGENGAGKSTLIKLLSGVYGLDSGAIYFDGCEATFNSPQESQRAGIRTLYQEPNLLPRLSVAENIFLGDEPRLKWLPLIDWHQMRVQAARLLDMLGLSIPPETPVSALSVAEQQMIELAKTLHVRARLLIMDEPTATLSRREVDILFRVIRVIKAQGIGVVFVSHRLDEVLEIADRATILRDGRRVTTVDIVDSSLDQLVRLISGRPGAHLFTRHRSTTRPMREALRLEGISRASTFEEVSFTLRSGEITGLTGPIGSGRTALVRAIFGLERFDSGSIFVNEQPVAIRSPQDAIALGIGLLPAERNEQALLLEMAAPENISLAALGSAGPLINRQEELALAEQYIDRLRIKLPAIESKVKYLSGGTQQKIILSRWLAVRSRILIFDEPTRGIDIGGKIEIYRLLADLARQGMAILIVSSEFFELTRLCDRVLVMRAGRLVASLEGDQITAEALTRHVVGDSTGP